MRTCIRKWWAEALQRLREERGQGMVEYGLILALVAVAVVVVLATLGDTLKGYFEYIVGKLGTPPTP